MALVMGGNLLGNHGRRLAQAREVMLDLHAPGEWARLCQQKPQSEFMSPSTANSCL